MKSLIKKIICSVSAVLIAFTCFSGIVSAAGQASTSLSVSPSAVDIGNTFTVTFKVSSSTSVSGIVGTLTYDSSKIEYTDNSENAKGTGGSLRIACDSDSNVSSISLKLTFKALAAGSSSLSFTPTEVIDYNLENLNCSGAHATATVKSPAALSGNADLSALKVSTGTLSPAFSPNTLSYSVTVQNNVTKLTLSATAADKNAKISVTGKNTLSVGSNIRSIKVTAPNGTVKTYTVNITRLAADGNVPSQAEVSSQDPVSEEPSNVITVYVGDTKMTVLEDFTNVEIPSGFTQDTVTVNDKTVMCVKNSAGIVMLYLSSDSGANFYIYDSENISFSEYATVEIAGTVYILLDKPRNVAVPKNFTAAELNIGSSAVSAWKCTEKQFDKFYLVYVCGPAKYFGFYLYDAEENTIQRFAEFSNTESHANTKPIDDSKNKLSVLAIYIIAGMGILIAALTIVLITVIVRRKKVSRTADKYPDNSDSQTDLDNLDSIELEGMDFNFDSHTDDENVK